ncbi:MAG: DUF4271 domain-containing protein [Bacteroidota bacterium]
MGKIRPIFIILLFSCLLFSQGIYSFAQEQNPFELTYRKGTKESIKQVSENPFDKLNPVKEVTKEEIIVKPLFTEQSTNFFLLITLLLLLALLLTFLRSFAIASIGALGTENLFNFLYREMSGRGFLPYLLLYIFFIVNMGIFCQFAMPVLLDSVHSAIEPNYFIVFFLPLIFLTLRHLLLTFIGFVFPIKKEMDRYQFLMVVTGISIGLLIAPMNIFFPYLNEEWKQIFILGALVFLGLILLYHYLRGLTLGVRFIGSHQFHFLLYICTVEIAPVLILVKLIINSL